jgi:hypothetical protein
MKTTVEQAADALRLWSNAWREFDKTGKDKPESFEEVIHKAIKENAKATETVHYSWNESTLNLLNQF